MAVCWLYGRNFGRMVVILAIILAVWPYAGRMLAVWSYAGQVAVLPGDRMVYGCMAVEYSGRQYSHNISALIQPILLYPKPPY